MNKARKSYTVNGAGVTSFIVVIGVSVFVTIAIIMKALDDAKARWQVYTLDVGQGLAVVIIKGRRAILYDTGASYPSGFNMVDAVIKPFLTFHGITHFDYVIISHLDNDHAGGLTKIVAEDLSQHIVVNQQTLNGKVNTCLQGKVITWQGLSIKALWPNHISARHNDDSCVIKITHPNGRILLTGDISKSVEKMLVTRFKADGTLDTDVLIAPHHGSLSSSSLAFLKASSPQFAIFSAGFINRWRHPRTEVMARYHAQKIKTYSTATDGMLKIDFTSRGIMVKRYRQEIWPFWFAN